MKGMEIIAKHYSSRETVRLVWREGVIARTEFLPRRAPGDWWVAPGLFDLQVNGFGGIDFQAEHLTREELEHGVRALAATGCTRLLLTLVTEEWGLLLEKLGRLRALRAQMAELQHAIAGWHLEGPFLSGEPGYCGAHDPALMCDPTPARIQELRAAVDAGASAFTHLGNGCPAAWDRHDNILWRVLEMRGLSVTLIPDRIHVSPPLFRLIHRVLPLDSILYISDAMAAAGTKPGRHRLGKLEVDVGPDGVVALAGRAQYAGSALRPADGVFRAAEMLGVPWQDTWPRFSRAPADWLGLPYGIGEGQPADFCLLRVSENGELDALRVFVRGQEVAQNGNAALASNS